MAESLNKYQGTREYFLVHAELVTAARYKGTVTYGEIAEIMGLLPFGNHMSSATGQMLGEISADEVSKGRHMLSSVAVRADGTPGNGFYEMAIILGKLAADTTMQEREAFWRSERTHIYDIWKRTPHQPNK